MILVVSVGNDVYTLQFNQLIYNAVIFPVPHIMVIVTISTLLSLVFKNQDV